MTDRTEVHLNTLGRIASDKFRKEGVSLNDVIGGMRVAHKLTDEEVHRVCETANKAAFLEDHHTKPAGARVVSFPPAVPAEIIAAHPLPKEGAEKKAGYRSPRTDGYDPRREAARSAGDVMMEKAAAARERNPAPGLGGRSTLPDLQQAVDTIRINRTSAERRLFMTKRAFREAAEEALGAHTLSQVVQALTSRIDEKQSGVLEELRPVIRDMKRRGMLKVGEFERDATDSNPDHPLVHAFLGMVDAKVAFDARDAEYKYAKAKLDTVRKGPQPCPDCGAAPGKEHASNCDKETCGVCHKQRLGCGCSKPNPTRTWKPASGASANASHAA